MPLVVLLVLLVIGCGGAEAPLPTLASQMVLPSATPTSLPATMDISTRQPVSGATTPGAEVLEGTAVKPTPKPTITPTAVDSLINISSPSENAVIVLGSPMTARGLVQRNPGEVVYLSLVSSNGRLLTEQQVDASDFGWQADIVPPPYVSGAAALRADLRTADGVVLSSYEIPVWLALNKDGLDRYLEMFRPQVNEKGVGGFNIFFDGEILLAVNRTITVSIWADDCQRRVAQQSFVLGASNRPVYWQGFVIVPQNLVGPACAVASTGEPGSETWREASVPIDVLAPTELEARGVTIGNPPPDSELIAGQALSLYGTALNVSEGPVSVSILLENGRVISQGSFTTDYWGYWETAITLPLDVEGLAEITVSAGEGDTFNESTTLIRIVPPPTPTPGP
ncbi:MAG: hypothetical protein IPM53_31180 [Anaerolineaceae bacterium]|nr:hypothetical protein [Anaerolineaceae bacterium]